MKYFKRELSIIYILGIVSLFLYNSCTEIEILPDIDETYHSKVDSVNPSNYFSVVADSLLVIPFDIARPFLGTGFKVQNVLQRVYKDNGLISLGLIAAPLGDNIFEGQKMFGYPSLAIKGQIWSVSCQMHVNGNLDSDNNFSGNFTVRSENGGEEWTNIEPSIKYAPHGKKLCDFPISTTLPDGNITHFDQGSLVSSDAVNWQHNPEAFEYSPSFSSNNLSSDVLNHSIFGLMVVGAQETENNGHIMASEDGYDWTVHTWKMDATKNVDGASEEARASAVELDNGDILMVSNVGSLVYQYLYHYQDGHTVDSIIFEGKALSNIVRANLTNPVVYKNPVTNTIEMLVSNAGTIGIWSITKEELYSDTYDDEVAIIDSISFDTVYTSVGNGDFILLPDTTWLEPEVQTFEYLWTSKLTLINIGGGNVIYGISSIIDEENNKQHIVFGGGHKLPTRTLLLKASRDLDTEFLKEWIQIN